MVSFDEFMKLELRVGKIITSERVEGSDKLLRLEVDIGTETRQIIAGIGKRYDPRSILGKEIIIVANLEPRKILNLESQGMLLAADNEGPVLLTPLEEVPPGSVIR